MWRDYWAAFEAGEFDKAYVQEWALAMRQFPRHLRTPFSAWCGA